MAIFWKAGCWLGLFGWAWLTPQSAQAFGDHDVPHPFAWIPGLMICNKTYNLPPHLQNLAPWYTYFPCDPAMMGPLPGTTYPTWPSSPPPPQPPSASRPLMSYPALPQGQLRGQTVGNWQAPVYQPVANQGNSVPSYWFAR